MRLWIPKQTRNFPVPCLPRPLPVHCPVWQTGPRRQVRFSNSLVNMLVALSVDKLGRQQSKKLNFDLDKEGSIEFPLTFFLIISLNRSTKQVCQNSVGQSRTNNSNYTRKNGLTIDRTLIYFILIYTGLSGWSIVAGPRGPQDRFAYRGRLKDCQ
jgi:hypothetical protein